MGLVPHVTLLASSSIVPASPTAVQRMFLPSSDALWQEVHYNRRLVFYPSAPVDAVQTLKTGLSLALVHYYPWAGRLARGEDKRLVIDCNDAGVEFVEATIDCALCEHAKTGFQMMGFYEQLCREVDHKGENLYTSPLLSVQVTRFSDGGLAVAVAQSHVVADGQSLWNFMVSWGECARGEALTVVPLHDRERLALPNPSAEKGKLDFAGEEEEEEEEAVAAGEEELGKSREDVGKHTDGLETQRDVHDETLVQCVFMLPGAIIQELKALAGGAHSAYVVMCAHFWKRVTAARRPTRVDTTSFTGLANLRSRWEPALPTTYFGNLIMFGKVEARATRVVGEEFHVTAGRVQKAVVKALDPEALLVVMHWLELHECKVSNADIKWQKKFPGMNVASSPRFPVYDVDYGWGRPAAVRAVRVHGNGEMVLFPGRPGSPAGDVEICMALPAPVLRRLLKDPHFLGHVPTSPFPEDNNN